MESSDFGWLVSHPEIGDEFSGEYIAVADTRVVAHGSDLKEVLAEAEKICEDPLIHKVPPRDRDLVA